MRLPGIFRFVKSPNSMDWLVFSTNSTVPAMAAKASSPEANQPKQIPIDILKNIKKLFKRYPQGLAQERLIKAYSVSCIE